MKPSTNKLALRMRLFVFLFVLHFGILNGRSEDAVSANVDIPSFTAEGVVSTEMLHYSDTNYFLKTDGKLLFTYSNGLWQIQFTYQHFYHPASWPSRLKMGTIKDCKCIPDGTREIIIPPNNTNFPTATTTTTPFPEMAEQEFFLPWLALCPNPELPMVNSNLIRFDLRPEMLHKPQNEGGFQVNYIEPEKQFLSELTVTNNGSFFESDGTVVKLPSPYNNGFIQFSYKVLDVTNCNGIYFPLDAVIYQFAPSPTGKSSADIYPAVISQLSVSRIDVSGGNPTLAPIPSHLMALDSRPADLAKGVTVNYGISNDQWYSTTNKNISQLVAMTLKNQSHFVLPGMEKYSNHRLVVRLILIILLLAPLIALIGMFFKKRNTNKIKPMKIKKL